MSKGTCLTVTQFDENSFKVGVSPETLRRSNLGTLRPGSRVNLERAVTGSTRLGGHLVQGHVDTVATILKITPDGNAKTIRFQPQDRDVLRYVIEKGFIAIDGASLTVTAVQDGPDGWWEVMLIAYTQERVVIASKKPGDLVNIEVDMVGKYVEKNVAAWFDSQSGESAALDRLVAKLVDERLRSKGL
jgi:riboflavin synthase